MQIKAMDKSSRRPVQISSLNIITWLAILVLGGYLALTGYAGYEVGRGIYEAKSNPLVNFGSNVVGRDAIETYVINREKLPRWITASPAFWIALRATE